MGQLITLNWRKCWLMILYRCKMLPPNCEQVETFVRVISNVEILWLTNPRDIWRPEKNFAGNRKRDL